MMKKVFLKIFTLVLLLSFVASPVIAQVVSSQTDQAVAPEWEQPQRPEPEMVPQEILDEFEGGMTIEEFLANHQGPIPNALLDVAQVQIDVIVQLDKPSLIEYLQQEGLSNRSGLREQTDYVAQLERDQAEVLGKITAARGSEVIQMGDGFTKVLNGFMLRVPANAVNEIRSLAGVKSVTQTKQYEPTLGASIPLINADDVWAYNGGYTGEGVTIAVIDTGIDYTHAMFGGSGDPADYASNDPDIIEPGTFPTVKVIGGYDFVGTNYDARGIYGSPIPVPDPDPLDENSHGTHVASTAAGFDVGFGSGVAPDALLYAVKVFGVQGSTTFTLHAIEWAMDPQGLGHLAEPVDVINMSLGSNWGPADVTDPEFIAVENATSIGVIVVSSAGNAGNSSYIVGSPSSTDSAISVAASSTGLQTAPYIEYEDAGTKYMPYTTSYNPFTTTITADLVDVVDFNVSGELCDITGLVGDELLGDIALIKRGSCNFAVKINNAEALGAVAAIIYNNTTGIISMDTSGSALPAGSILQSDGLLLKGLAPIEISIGPDSNVRTFVSADPPDTIATFSSRGPRGFDSKLKPEITAPGVSIFAADMGTGNLGTSSSGTSMAAPHVAGVAALMVEANPGWDPVHIKAAMMNTAVDLADPASAQIPRQGAGRVDAYESITTSVVAYADPKLVSLSWGVIEVDDDFSDTQLITLRNFGAMEITLDVGTYFTSSSSAGATLTPAVSSVTVPAFGAGSVEVTLDLVASLLPISFGGMEEYYGFVTFTAGSETLRLPFYFVPRPYTELTEIDAVTRFEVNDYGWVGLEHSGPVPSSLWSYPVSLVSPHNPMVLDAADLRYVGMDYGWFQPGYGDIFVPAFAMWGGVHTNQPFFNEVDLYIDTPYGSVVNFNYNYAWYLGAGQNNQWLVIQVDFADGMVYLGSPWLIYADYNSGFQEWYLPAPWQYVVDEFDYEVVSFDWNGNFDYGGAANFDLTKTPLVWGLTESSPYQEDFYLLFAVPDWYAYNASGIQGIMLVDYHGKPGAGQSYYWPLDVYFNYFLPTFFR
jgi:minor extracellular serine protease Vpr